MAAKRSRDARRVKENQVSQTRALLMPTTPTRSTTTTTPRQPPPRRSPQQRPPPRRRSDGDGVFCQIAIRANYLEAENERLKEQLKLLRQENLSLRSQMAAKTESGDHVTQ